LSEREARCIIGQVFAALRYINARNDTIIHYDLKPGNILFHKGEVKITDFGLSKVVLDAAASDAGGSGLGQIELTSQGAGTYWYLPPECLRASGPGGRPASISSAVDVYSAGVVLFQMLYGKKPFGQGLSPDDMSALSQRTGPDAHRVTFPEAPVVSQASKDFIQHCLMYDPLKRPNIKTLHTLPYFNPKAIPLGTTAK
jgi:tousled-like kinase